MRGCFVSEANKKLVIADYSQIELRVVAEISNDLTMIAAYKAGRCYLQQVPVLAEAHIAES